MAGNRMAADGKLFADLIIAETLGKQAEYLFFALGQAIDTSMISFLGGSTEEIVHQGFGQGWVNINLIGLGCADGGDQVVRSSAFWNIAHGTGLEHLEEILLVFVDGQSDY